MAIRIRSYNHSIDLSQVKQFLAATFLRKNSFQLWIPTRFENAVFFDINRSKNVQLWVETNKSDSKSSQHIVGVSIIDPPNQIYTLVHPGYKSLIDEMICIAENRIMDNSSHKVERIVTYVAENDTEHTNILNKHGYDYHNIREHVRCRSPHLSLPPTSLPQGFHITSIGEDSYTQYMQSIEIVFGHKLFTSEVFAAMRTTHFYHSDLLLGVFTQNDTLVSFAMIRIDENKIAELEPVGTLPAFRRKGLAKAVLIEALYRTLAYNPRAFYVGGAPTSEADRLYTSLGFTDKKIIQRWIKEIN
ncbi:MAG: GNAT family N-acetyltransferase [Candidatus Lokiarchaeota archaeon]|nr:GNAT family N-acetyltransferase [Candidatus Lokiarchaeota archaeon]